MTQELWTFVDQYLVENLIPADSALDAALESNKAAGLPTIDVAPNQGKLLHLFARMQGARRIPSEIRNYLGGYNTIWLARALPSDGKLITLEVEPKHAEVALANIKRAELSGLVELRLGPALESLAKLHSEGAKPFDLIFIDWLSDEAEDIPRLSSTCHPQPLASQDRHHHRQRHPRRRRDQSRGPYDPRVQGVRRFFEKLASPIPISIQRRSKP